MSEEKLSFEQAMKELDSIISRMDSGEMPLEQSVENFKRGTELIKYCDTLLDSFEKSITAVTAGKDGQPEEVPVKE